MSVKGKNLSYEAQEPSFLRKLRAQNGGMDGDRHERPVARPKRVIVDRTEEDYGPTYVDEASNKTLTKEEYESMLRDVDGATTTSTKDNCNANEADLRDSTDALQLDSQTNARKIQEVTEVGKSQKKRKVVKVVGVSDEVDGEENSGTSTNKKAKKKTPKALKLSFATEEHGET